MQYQAPLFSQLRRQFPVQCGPGSKNRISVATGNVSVILQNQREIFICIRTRTAETSELKGLTLNILICQIKNDTSNTKQSGQEGLPEDEKTDEKEGDKDGEAKEEDEPGVGRGGGQRPPQAVLLVLPFCGVRYIECHRAGNERYVGGMLQDTRKHI